MCTRIGKIQIEESIHQFRPKRGSIMPLFVSGRRRPCPYDPPLPREWAARQVNLVHFTDFPRGGHFMAWEEPELYVGDLQDFVSDLRN